MSYYGELPWYRRYQGALSRLAILASAALLVSLGLRLCQLSATGGASFLGAFLIVTGVQVGLWAIGIRLELLNNTVAPDVRAPREAFTEPIPRSVHEEGGISETYTFRECVMNALHAIRSAEASMSGGIFRAVAYTEGNSVASRIIQQAQDNPTAAMFVLSSEVERSAAQVADAVKSWSPSPMEDRNRLMESLSDAYESFRTLRDSALHDPSVTLDARTAYEVIDIGDRLLRLLARAIAHSADEAARSREVPSKGV